MPSARSSSARLGVWERTSCRNDGRTSMYRIGTVIAGRYQLRRPLGRGGASQVWIARHQILGTDVAVKLLTTSSDEATAAAEACERFRFEAQISARLGAKTQHAVAVHDAGMHGQMPYLVMELVRGRTLQAEIDWSGAVEPDWLADVLTQVAEALAVAHEMGIIHRDLKPSNILLVNTTDRSVLAKVADFGIVKAFRADLSIERPKETAPGLWIGTPAYMSPEQRAARNVGPQSDLWSLGVVAYEALTGWLPFGGRSVNEIDACIGAGHFDPPSVVRASLPRSLNAWFERALARDPAERFQSAPEMAAAFRAAIARPRRIAARAGAAIVIAGAAALLAAKLLVPPPVSPTSPPPVGSSIAGAAAPPLSPASPPPAAPPPAAPPPARPPPSPGAQQPRPGEGAGPARNAGAPSSGRPVAAAPAARAAEAPPAASSGAPREAPAAEPAPEAGVDPSAIQ